MYFNARYSKPIHRPALLAASIGAALALGHSGSALAQADATATRELKHYSIAAGPLGQTLNAFAQQAGIAISFNADLVEGRRSQGLQGRFAVDDGLARLLTGHPLRIRATPSGYLLERSGDALTVLPSMKISADAAPVSNEVPDTGFKADYQISATRAPLPIRQTPQSISVVTQEALQARQVLSLGQALETVAGVTPLAEAGPFGGRGYTGGATFQIRGMQAPAPQLFGTLEDGFLALQLNGTNDLAPYERVEVLKGPGSVMYGRGSAGGFINLVRKKPQREFHADIASSLGSFDFYRVDADVTGPFDKTGAARGRMVLAYEDAGAFVDHVGSDRAVLAPSVAFDISERTRLLLQGSWQHDNFVQHSGLPLKQVGDDYEAFDVRRSLFTGSDPKRNDATQWSLGAQLEQQLDDRWLATLRLNKQAPKQNVDVDAYTYGYSPAGDVYVFSIVADRDADLWAGEIRLNGEIDLFGNNASVMLGAERNDFDYQRSNGFVMRGTANLYRDDIDALSLIDVPISNTTDQRYRSDGVYAQLQLRPIDRLSILLGGRHDKAKSRSIDTYGIGTPDLSSGTSDKTDEEFTWRLGATFDVTASVSTYALYASSFAPNPFATGRDGILEPETAHTWELGVKSDWLDNRLGINAALFRIDRDDMPINDPANGPTDSFNINGGLQRSDGVELEINGQPLPGLAISAALAVLDAEFIERDDAATYRNTPKGAADWQLGLHASYEVQQGALRGFGVGVNVFAIDERAVSNYSRATIDGYERVDLQVFYNGFERTTLALLVRNVFDENYIEGLSGPNSSNYVGAPTAVLLRAQYSFGD